jgi:NAD(P)-dependent dehydrogenase (short-subunit alcohol dehydrogenase family)
MSEKTRRVVVAGASSGIGWATARRFAREGYQVCALARRGELLKRLADEIGADRCTIVAGDYSDDATIARLIETIRSAWGGIDGDCPGCGKGDRRLLCEAPGTDRRLVRPFRQKAPVTFSAGPGLLDVLVNSAGISRSLDLLDSPWDQWRAAMDVMIDGAVKLTRALAPLMLPGGRIIHVTSIHAHRAERGSSSYGMAKAAIEQFCRSAALELADRGILVNAVAPGFVNTPMSSASGVNELETEWFRANYVAGHHLPLRRAAEPEEIAGVALFLAGPDATYITGHTLTVDGGLSITF